MSITKETFMDSLTLINDENLREEVRNILETIIPEAFWTVPASSSGKYHPEDECQAGGTLLHTLRVVNIAKHLCDMVNANIELKDTLIAAALLHDTCTHGKDGKLVHSISKHDVLLRELLIEKKVKLSGKLILILYFVEHHAGRWGTIPSTPRVDASDMLHIADLVASRRNIKVGIV